MTAAVVHAPLPTKNNSAVATIPIAALANRKRLRAPPASAIAPSAGATSAMARLESELATPSRYDDSVASTPALQYCLNNSGKNPAITVVEKAEFAQS